MLVAFLVLLASTNMPAENNAVDRPRDKRVFYLEPESPLNQQSLDLSKPLFIGETSLGFNLRAPLEGTSGGNACSSCAH